MVKDANDRPGEEEPRHALREKSETLHMNIRGDLAAAARTLEEGRHEAALKHLQHAIQGKHELYVLFLPQLEPLAQRCARYTRYTVGLEKDDLLDLAYVKFLHAIHVWDPSRGSSLLGWVLFTLGRYFIGLGRGRRRPATSPFLDLYFSDGRRRLDDSSLLDIRDLVDTLLTRDPRAPEKRRALLLYGLHGYTMQDIAGEMQVSVGTVHKWLMQIGCALAETVSDLDRC